MILVTISDDDYRKFKSIALLNTDKLTLNMDSENLWNVQQALPKKWKQHLIIRLDKLDDVVDMRSIT